MCKTISVRKFKCTIGNENRGNFNNKFFSKITYSGFSRMFFQNLALILHKNLIIFFFFLFFEKKDYFFFFFFFPKFIILLLLLLNSHIITRNRGPIV